ncbi:MAG TPA: response regulator [Verrucomicrobiae bacterium]
MITDSYPVSATLEPVGASGAEPHWAGPELSAEPAVVRRQRILLVEDEELLRRSLRMILEFEGYQVTEAANGAEALSLFTVSEFDLVITDFEMPVVDGSELAVGIKRLAPSLPILMVTGSQRACCGVGNPADALLSKPFTVPDLRCALGKLLSARPVAARPCAVLV